MKILNFRNTKRIVIEPGEFYVTRESVVLSTILGSCVSCCLYDENKGYFGMNHFLLSQPLSSSKSVISSDAGRYGIHAMELLINEMMKLGTNKKDIKAKCFGGSDILKLTAARTNQNVGAKNIRFIKEYFSNENIPVTSSDLGGHAGRTIYFFGEDFSVYLKRTTSTRKQDQIIKEELNYLERISSTQDSANQSTGSQLEYW